MWSAFNAGGKTLFLEEDPKWVDTVLKGDKSHFLRAHTVKYPTQLQQSNELLRSYKSEPGCLPPKTFLKGNRRCRLALPDLPQEVYETEWDLVMDGAIYSAAVMARNRKGKGLTDVFLHDVNRPVERTYATEFLCKKNLVDGTGRLWHFRIPPVRDEGAEAPRASANSPPHFTNFLASTSDPPSTPPAKSRRRPRERLKKESTHCPPHSVSGRR
ncbi:unnamed protein product [Spirodela intermedia]|uniref:Uncharacterized protein n=1 Tax=Spirodela intermedia TaxID=51605 RepID=A0A7I8IPP2_SPIIN|nr:unnamed protein product [Spirodela intermedia]CAA6659937.1 unnamed protein product [Spirodela intermedia]